MRNVGGAEASANIHPIAVNAVPHQSTRKVIVSNNDRGNASSLFQFRVASCTVQA